MEPADVRILLPLVECPVCNLYMQSTIYQCCNGHTVCDKCKPKLEKCPNCPENSMEIRNLALEYIAMKLCYPCKFKYMGCTDLIFLHDRLDHEMGCYFKMYTCFLPTDDLQMCTFSSPIYKLKDHMLQCHADRTSVQENGGVIFNKVLNFEHVFCWSSVIIAYQEIFFCSITSNHQGIFGFVKHIGPLKETGKYMSEITIMTKNKNFTIMSPVCDITMAETDPSYFLPLNPDDAKLLVNDGNSLCTKIRILKFSTELTSRQGTNTNISTLPHNRITQISTTGNDCHRYGAQASENSTDRNVNISREEYALPKVKTFRVISSTNGAIPKIGAASTSKKIPLKDKKIKTSTGYEEESHSDFDEGPSKSAIGKTMRSSCADNFDEDEQTASQAASSKSKSGNVAISSDIKETSPMKRNKPQIGIKNTLTYAQAVKWKALEGSQGEHSLEENTDPETHK